jgi:hypothetical protein
MKIGDQTKNGEVVFVRDEYFVTETKSTVYASMFRVYQGTYWRTLFTAGNGNGDALERCKEWIGNRRCYKCTTM